MSGVFIAFEGGEGAGKSTQASLLCDTLRRNDCRAVLVHEPGSTSLGDYLRRYLIGNKPAAPLAELLLFEASRAQLMAECIRPEMAAGAVIIADRFAGSTIAYQGYGRGVDLERIAWLNDLATGGCYPDLTILLDVDPVVGLERVHSRQVQLTLPIGDAPDRFEDEILSFHDTVRRGFLKQIDAGSSRWRRVNGNGSVDDVADQVWAAVRPLLIERDLLRLA